MNGRFKDLDVDKVIAVSASGFSAAAREKALANRIDARTLEHALETSWATEFMKLGVAVVKIEIRFVNAVIVTDPDHSGSIKPSHLFVDRNGHHIGSVRDVLYDCFTRHSEPHARAYLEANYLSIHKTVADLYKDVEICHTVRPAVDLQVILEGRHYRVVNIDMQMRGSSIVEKGYMKHRLYDKACIATADIQLDRGETRLHAVQIAGNGSIAVSLTEKHHSEN